jgi:GLPGLI family protein
MKKLILCIALFSCQAFFCQETSKGRIAYRMTTLFSSVQNYDAELLYNNETASFKYVNLQKEDIETVDDITSNSNIILADTVTKIIHIDKKIGKLYHYASIFLRQSPNWVEETNPEIDWTLLEETKKIGSFVCNKATTRFRGRNYTAWYCPEIKGNFGPWKLQGLPGMILEAHDEKREVIFEMKKIETPFSQNIDFDLSKIKILKKEEVLKVQKEKQEEFSKRMASKVEKGMTLQLKFGNNPSIEME